MKITAKFCRCIKYNTKDFQERPNSLIDKMLLEKNIVGWIALSILRPFVKRYTHKSMGQKRVPI